MTDDEELEMREGFALDTDELQEEIDQMRARMERLEAGLTTLLEAMCTRIGQAVHQKAGLK